MAGCTATKKRNADSKAMPAPPAKMAVVEPWRCFYCVDKVVLRAACPTCGGNEQASDERRADEPSPACYWNGCDLGRCEGCGMHATSVCQRLKCGADGCMEMEPCFCDCSCCNCDSMRCDCSNPGKKKLLPGGTLIKLTSFQAIVRGRAQRVDFMLNFASLRGPDV